ncbi:MAG: hypothetical protein AAF797_03215 [Planctomycetota bacterium]
MTDSMNLSNTTAGTRVCAAVVAALWVVQCAMIQAEPSEPAQPTAPVKTTAAAFEALPATLFGKDTAWACYADLTRVQEEDLAGALSGLDEVLAPTYGDAQAADDIADLVLAYSEFRTELMAAGGTALVLLADLTPDQTDAIRPVLLVGVSEDAEASGVLSALQPLLDGVVTASDDATLQRVAPGWMKVEGVGRLGSGQTDGTAENRDTLAEALSAHAELPLRMAMRITPAMRSGLRRAAGLPAEGETQEMVLTNAFAVVVRDVAERVVPIERVSLAARVDEGPRVEGCLWFPGEEEAEAFGVAADGFLNLAGQLMAPAEGDTTDRTTDINRLLAAARMTREGRRLRAELKTEDLAVALKLGPSLAMMLLMGNTDP